MISLILQPHSRLGTKTLSPIPTKLLETRNLHSGTYPYSLYPGILPPAPPRGGANIVADSQEIAVAEFPEPPSSPSHNEEWFC